MTALLLDTMVKTHVAVAIMIWRFTTSNSGILVVLIALSIFFDESAVKLRIRGIPRNLNMSRLVKYIHKELEGE